MDTEPHDKIEFSKSLLEKEFLNYPSINWALMAYASYFYSSRGYVNKETPWLIPTDYTKLTKPHQDASFVQSSGMFEKSPHELVGSAEQGFIYLICNNLIIPGKYFSVSPCFRVEKYDSLHQPWFMKLELIQYGTDVNEQSLEKLISDAFTFFSHHTKGKLQVVELQDNTFDINLNGIEIGSYGIRKANDKPYIYGTGLALPRFSLANKK